MKQLWSQLSNMTTTDVIDILMLSVIFYAVLSLLKRTRSIVAMRGLLAVVFFSLGGYIVARAIELSGMAFFFGYFWIIIALIFLIVFQNDFKMALTDLGQLRVFRAFFKQSGEYVEELVEAAEELSLKKTGALIAIERRNPLKVYVETGTPIDADVSSELIRTIFTNLTPLHDGAMIIRNNRIEAAGCILPLTTRTDISNDLGTRHRAAIGLSEETDAAVIIVSEETGAVSLALKGQIQRGLGVEKLKDELKALLHVKAPEEKSKNAAE